MTSCPPITSTPSRFNKNTQQTTLISGKVICNDLKVCGGGVPVRQGGTGRESLSPVNSILLSGTTATSEVQVLTSGANGTVLTSAGPGVVPTWVAAGGGGGGSAIISGNASIVAGNIATAPPNFFSPTQIASTAFANTGTDPTQNPPGAPDSAWWAWVAPYNGEIGNFVVFASNADLLTSAVFPSSYDIDVYLNGAIVKSVSFPTPGVPTYVRSDTSAGVPVLTGDLVSLSITCAGFASSTIDCSWTIEYIKT